MMSFSNNCKPEKMPGVIKGNPVNGLNEKACIQVNKVFDACMKQETLQNLVLDVTNITPSDLTPPFQFISAKSSTTAATIENLVVSELPDSNCCARVSGNVVIPLTVVVVDSAGRQGVGSSSITIPKDVILHISAPSVMPYQIEAMVTAMAPEGVYNTSTGSTATFTVTACTTVILRVVMQVELLVPTYGYAYIPPCQEFTQEVCSGIFDLPLYPGDGGTDPRCCNS